MLTSVRSQLRFDVFTLDTTRYVLTRGASELPLRRQSFDVLRYLAEHAGQVISSDELIAAVWSSKPADHSASVSQCIREIRRALGEDARWIIKTVSGQGYKFTASVFQPEVAGSESAEVPEEIDDTVLPFGHGAADRPHPSRPPPVHPRNTILFASSILIAVVVATAWLVWSQRQRETTAEQRVALLIGNSNYKSWGTPLKNPKNDVKALGRQLRGLGFTTTVIYDGTSEQISTAIKAFRDDAAGSDWALIYYAGAGIEVDGTDYMIPIDADDRRAAEFTKDFEQMRLDTAFEAVQGARRLRLVVADACRVEPSRLSGDSGQSQANPSRKFKVVPPPHGVVVAYSTDAGQQAQDGMNDISPYAEALAEALREPGIEISKVFRRVSARVEAITKRAQSPTILGNWPGEDLYVSRK